MTAIELKQLPIEALQRGRYQPRQTFEKEALQELAHSIQSQGLIEPLVVREVGDQQYEIIAGERRWRAAALAGLEKIPCIIRTYSDEQAAAVTLIENIQRQELNLMEEAQGYERLSQEFHFSQEDIALLVGKSRSHIANILRLLSLSSFVQDQLRSKLITLGHARVLVGLSIEQQRHLAEKSIKNNWSVRRLEDEVRHIKLNEDASRTQCDSDIQHLETYLAEHIGSPVEISTDNSRGGWLKIKFFDPDTLAGILEKMGLRYD